MHAAPMEKARAPRLHSDAPACARLRLRQLSVAQLHHRRALRERPKCNPARCSSRGCATRACSYPPERRRKSETERERAYPRHSRMRSVLRLSAPLNSLSATDVGYKSSAHDEMSRFPGNTYRATFHDDDRRRATRLASMCMR